MRLLDCQNERPAPLEIDRLGLSGAVLTPRPRGPVMRTLIALGRIAAVMLAAALLWALICGAFLALP